MGAIDAFCVLPSRGGLVNNEREGAYIKQSNTVRCHTVLAE